jgi:integrase/recombinase XerD
MFAVDEFIKYLEAQQYRKTTIWEYAKVLNDFRCYLKVKKIDDVSKITSSIVIGFFNTFLLKGIVTKYHRSKITWITNYFRYLEENQKIFLSPLRDYTPPKYHGGSHPALKKEEMTYILKKIKTNKPIFIKAIAMIELMYSSALRPREVYNLKVTDIDFVKGALFIQQSKNKKDRIVPVGKKALFWLEKYIKDIRPNYEKGCKNNYVFINHKTGKQLTCRGVRYIIQFALKENGLKVLKPYSLRSTAATELLLNGMPIEYIGNLLGHVELRTTQIYLKVKKQELERVLKDKHPRNVNSKAINSK